MALSQPAIELPSAVVETPVLEAPPAAPGPDDRLPDWLQDREQGAVAPAPSAQVDTNWMEGGRAAAEELWPSAPMAPLPEPEAPAAVVQDPVVVEAPVTDALAQLPEMEAPVLSSVEDRLLKVFPLENSFDPENPFTTIKQFNVYMETIRDVQAVLASGVALSPESKKQALIAVARANSLLPKLPGEVLKSVLLMRAVASGNPRFGRDDFQLEMLAAMKVIKTGAAFKG